MAQALKFNAVGHSQPPLMAQALKFNAAGHSQSPLMAKALTAHALIAPPMTTLCSVRSPSGRA